MSESLLDRVSKLLDKSGRIEVDVNDPSIAHVINELPKAKARLELSRNGIVVDMPTGGRSHIAIYRIGEPQSNQSKNTTPERKAAEPRSKPRVKRSQHTYVPPAMAEDMISVILDEASHVIQLVGPTQCGKAQPYDSVVQTPTGPVRMGDLVVGDEVLGGDGRPCTVKAIFEQGIRPVCRVDFDGNEVSTECDMNHNWKYMRRGNMNENRSLRNGRKRGNRSLNKWEVLTTAEIMKVQGLDGGNEIAVKRGCVPVCGAAEFSGRVPSVFSPYVMGALLGDGHFPVDGNIGISSADTEILDRISAEIPGGFVLKRQGKYDYRIKASTRDGWEDRRRSPLKTEMRRLGLLGLCSFEKFIPNEYKFVDSRSRMELLRGLMDTDGSIGKVSRMEFSTTSERLVDDVAWLVRSLGGKCKISRRRTSYCHLEKKKVGRLSYRLAVKIMENPFYVSRKSSKFYPIKRRKDRILHRVVKVGEKRCRCISVDSLDSTYLTDDFIVTHNTTVVKHIGGKMGRKVFQINCRGDMGSEAFFGEKTVEVDDATKQNKIVFQRGVVEQAMIEGLDDQGNEVGDPGILFVDEASAAPAHIIHGLNRLLESDDVRRTLVINEDGGRIVRSHSGFRIVLAGNTVGRGANTVEESMYAAQRDALDISLLNRVAVTFRMGYDRNVERHIVIEKTGDDHVSALILKFRDAIRAQVKAGKLASPFSTKRIIDIANMHRVFGDIGKAVFHVCFEQLLPEEKPIYNEHAVAIFGKDLIRAYANSKNIDY